MRWDSFIAADFDATSAATSATTAAASANTPTVRSVSTAYAAGFHSVHTKALVVIDMLATLPAHQHNFLLPKLWSFTSMNKMFRL